MNAHRSCRGAVAPVRRRRSVTRGFASVLAMLYLILFSVLAVGFYAACTMSAQIAGNERNIAQARSAAESGMEFIRYQLQQMTIPSSDSGATLLSDVSSRLGGQLNGASNMGGNTVGITSNTICIPSSTSYIVADSAANAKFQVQITASGSILTVTSIGYGTDATVGRAVQMQFTGSPIVGSILNFGIASKGMLSMSNTVNVIGSTGDSSAGSVLSATAGAHPLVNSGNGSSFSGDFSYTNASGTNSYGNLSIDGYLSSDPNFAQHVHAGVAPPTFPTIDTSMFLPYATNTYGNLSGGTDVTLVNTILQANGNYNFSGNSTIQGVLYIKTPNKISFSGPVSVQGAIVVENNPQGSPSTNQLKFTNTVTFQTMDTLPANATFPSGERALTGSVILAPDFELIATNTFGSVGGDIVASEFDITNTFTATVYGSIINLADNPMTFTNTANITIVNNGVSQNPAGLSFGSKYVPNYESYAEVGP